MAFVTTSLILYVLFAVLLSLFLFKRSKPLLNVGMAVFLVVLMFALHFSILIAGPLSIFIFYVSYQYAKRGSPA